MVLRLKDELKQHGFCALSGHGGHGLTAWLLKLTAFTAVTASAGQPSYDVEVRGTAVMADMAIKAIIVSTWPG
jgi:hypothetical protein